MSNTNKYSIKYIHKTDERVIANVDANTGAPLLAVVSVLERLVAHELDVSTTITLVCFVLNRLSVTINMWDDRADIVNTLDRVGADDIRRAVELVCAHRMSLSGVLHYLHQKRIVTVDALLDFQEHGANASANWREHRSSSIVYELCGAINEACGLDIINTTAIWSGGVYGTAIEVMGVESWQEA